MSETQWNIKVRIVELDRGSTVTPAHKNRWVKGDTVLVQIEPHATINMLKQRIAMLVAAHHSWQTLKIADGAEALDDVLKLSDAEGLADNGMLDLCVNAPKEPQEELGELSDDPEAMTAEDVLPPALPDAAAMEKQLAEEEEDRQNKFKGEAAEAIEDGNKEAALQKLTDAIMVGNPGAMLLAKRGELLLKMKRPKAAILDATAALAKNPDSAKAYRLRAKAHRYLSMWDEAVVDFANCQKIDYDDDLKEVHEFCNRRKKWHAKKRALEAKKAAED
mmetsp:Transcript_55798/g.173145  ORF Transcript_55798/g.173145 Transcript_55798/m.173145 type:complete len:276 (-) Transcript_55798:117-944(-)